MRPPLWTLYIETSVELRMVKLVVLGTVYQRLEHNSCWSLGFLFTLFHFVLFLLLN